MVGLPARKTDAARERMTRVEPLRLGRAEQVAAVDGGRFDMIIVGGGVTGVRGDGCGAARL